MSSMKQKFKRILGKAYRIVHNTLVYVFRAIKGFLVRTNWHLREKKRDYEALKSIGDIKLRPISINSWHLGNSFFKCTKGNEVFFVKRIRNKFLAQREVGFYTDIFSQNDSELVEYLPKYYASFNSKEDTYIVLEYIDWKTISRTEYKQLTMEDRQDYVLTLFKILNLLRDHHYTHNDIRKENIFIKDGKVKLFDYGYAVKFEDADNLRNTATNNELKRLNENNRPSSEYLDDAYSMLNIMKSINPEMYYNQSDLLKRMNALIGSKQVPIAKLKSGDN